MNLTRIQYFVEAASCESFTEAAKRLYTTQPNLSKQIAAFESEIGAKLFMRANRSVYLTQAGKYLYEQLRDIPERMESAFERARALSRRAGGMISVGVLEGQGATTTLADRLQKLSSDNPGMEFDLERNSFSNLRRGLINTHYDIIITLSFELDGWDDVEYTTIHEQFGALAVPRSLPKSEQENLTLADFKDAGFISISPDESPNGYNLLIEQCSRCGFVPNIVRRAQSPENMLLCVEAGLGVALLSTNTRLESSGDVRILPLPESAASNIVAVWMKGNNNPVIAGVAAGLVAGM